LRSWEPHRDIRKQVRKRDLRRRLNSTAVFTGWADLIDVGANTEGSNVPYSYDSLTLKELNMKHHNRKLLTGSILAAFGITLGGLALADVTTRSTEDMNADLMRTYQSPGGPPAGAVGTRSEAGNYSELMRDWDGKLTNRPGTIVGTASIDPLIIKGGSRTLKDVEFGRR
jgi:hypothetical protein